MASSPRESERTGPEADVAESRLAGEPGAVLLAATSMTVMVASPARTASAIAWTAVASWTSDPGGTVDPNGQAAENVATTTPGGSRESAPSAKPSR